MPVPFDRESPTREKSQMAYGIELEVTLVDVSMKLDQILNYLMKGDSSGGYEN